MYGPHPRYLTNGTLPANLKEADRVRRWPNWCILYVRILYKRSLARAPTLRDPRDGKEDT